jgi:hypothetical protein
LPIGKTRRSRMWREHKWLVNDDLRSHFGPEIQITTLLSCGFMFMGNGT